MAYLLGYKKFESKKDGKQYCIANVCYEYTDKEVDNGCIGSRCEEVFLPDEFVDLLTPSDIMKSVELSYEKVGQYFRVAEFSVLS